MPAEKLETAEGRYKQGMTDRQCFLDEAFKSSRLTLPSLIPDTQDICQRESPVELPKPWQSLGSRGTNNLGSRLLTTLFPPTSPFLRYQISPNAKRDAKIEQIDLGPIEADLARREAIIQGELDRQGLRTKLFAVTKHLLVAGNVVVRKIKGAGAQIFPLNAFVVKRDTEGELIEGIVVEKHVMATITDQAVLDVIASSESNIDPQDPNAPVPIFTSVKRVGKKFRVIQEVGGVEIESTEQTFTKRKLPWLFLRYTAIDGENYGRSFIEEYRGDLTSFETMSRDMIFASANAAKLLVGIDPSSSIDVHQLNKLENGQYFSGREGEVWYLRMDKGGDMQVAFNQLAKLETALSADFLLNSAFQRNGERVTATEIRAMAAELEDALGGVFSQMGQELQLPLALLIEDELISDGALEPLDEDTVRIGIVTGLAAIGRGQDLTRLDEAITRIINLAPAFPDLKDYVDEGALNARIWAGTGVDTQGLIRSDKEVAELRQQRQSQQLDQMAAQEMAKGAGGPVGQVAADGLRQQREIPVPSPQE